MKRLCWNASWRDAALKPSEVRAWFRWYSHGWGRNTEGLEKRHALPEHPSLAMAVCLASGWGHPGCVCERLEVPLSAVPVKDRVEAGHW